MSSNRKLVGAARQDRWDRYHRNEIKARSALRLAQQEFDAWVRVIVSKTTAQKVCDGAFWT